MANDPLQRIWDQPDKEAAMSMEQFEAVLRQHVRRSGLRWSWAVWVYLAFIAATLAVQGLSLYAFRSNPPMLAAAGAFAALTLGFFAYGIHVLRVWTALGRSDESLAANLRRRLRFYRTQWEAWLWMIAFTSVLFTFAANTAIDAKNGEYRIHRPLVYFVVTLGQLLIVYAGLKFSQRAQIRETLALLGDLERQSAAGLDQALALRQAGRRWILLAVAALAAFALLGAWFALN